MHPQGLWRHRLDLGGWGVAGKNCRKELQDSGGQGFVAGLQGVMRTRAGVLLCECRDPGGIQAIVANFEEFGESRGSGRRGVGWLCGRILLFGMRFITGVM